LSDTPLLEVQDLAVAYGHVQAVRGVSLRVWAGQIVTLIGPNGAGKSSTLGAICGLVPPAGGRVLLKGEDVTRLPAHRAAARGIVLVPEGRLILQSMTVEENLRIAADLHPRAPDLAKRIEEQLERFPVLGERRRALAGQLSGGEQQMLAIARGLLQAPRVLLLDEPSMGLAPLLVQQTFGLIEQIHREGTTLLLVEQNARIALRISGYAYVLERGCVVLEGPASQLAEDPRVQAVYLGGI